MALTKIGKEGITGISNSSDATAITIDSSENVTANANLTVTGNSTLNGKFLIDGSNNDLMTFRTTGDTASQVLGLQFQNNSEAVTSQIFATGDNSTSHVFRIKSVGSIELHGGDIAVSGDATKMMKIDSSGVAQFKSSGISAGNQVFQVIDDGATLFQIRAEDGNISFPQSGAGIYLGVTAGTASNLLNDYEEGTWIATITGESGAITSYSVESATYTKIGDTVHLHCRFSVSDKGTGTNFVVSGFPFTSVKQPLGTFAETNTTGLTGFMFNAGTNANAFTSRRADGWGNNCLVNGNYTVNVTYRT
jgi:hypothetical protein